MKITHFLAVVLTTIFLAIGLTRGQDDLCQTPDEYDIKNLTM
jgi:hypothetical protein